MAIWGRVHFLHHNNPHHTNTKKKSSAIIIIIVKCTKSMVESPNGVILDVTTKHPNFPFL